MKVFEDIMPLMPTTIIFNIKLLHPACKFKFLHSAMSNNYVIDVMRTNLLS